LCGELPLLNELQPVLVYAVKLPTPLMLQLRAQALRPV